jgi:hypothetical protein
MLKIENFKGYDGERGLCWKRFSKDESMYEAILNFCFEPIKDNAWYQITIGQCFENDYKEIENHRFNSLKKAIKWWNEYFGEDDKDDVRFAI